MCPHPRKPLARNGVRRLLSRSQPWPGISKVPGIPGLQPQEPWGPQGPPTRCLSANTFSSQGLARPMKEEVAIQGWTPSSDQSEAGGSSPIWDRGLQGGCSGLGSGAPGRFQRLSRGLHSHPHPVTPELGKDPVALPADHRNVQDGCWGEAGWQGRRAGGAGLRAADLSDGSTSRPWRHHLRVFTH